MTLRELLGGCAHAEGRAAAHFGRLLAVPSVSGLPKEGDVRVKTAFNRMLRLPGAWVQDVSFGGEG